MNDAEQLKEYDVEVAKVSGAIEELNKVRRDIWRKRDALFNKCLEV